MYKKKLTRIQEIENYILSNKEVSFDELIEKFGVNKTTIHRDITEIEKRGKIKKVLSGAISVTSSILDSSNEFYTRASKNWDEKRAISKEAFKFIKPNQFYFFDGSSTLLPLIREISRSNIKDITIVTSSIIFQMELANNQNIKIIGLGGELNKDNSVTAGPNAWRHISEYYADAFFFSVGGVNNNLMLTDLKEDNAINTKLFIEHSKDKILLIVHEKFEVSSHFFIENINKVNTLITGYHINKKYLDKLKKVKGLNVITVNY